MGLSAQAARSGVRMDARPISCAVSINERSHFSAVLRRRVPHSRFAARARHKFARRWRAAGRRGGHGWNQCGFDAKLLPVSAGGEIGLGNVERGSQFAQISGQLVELDVPQMDDQWYVKGLQFFADWHGVVTLGLRHLATV